MSDDQITPSFQYVTMQDIEDARTQRGVRRMGRDEHYDLCNGLDCPCFREGLMFKRASHLDVLDHFCGTDPEFVAERLALANGSPTGGGS